MTRQLTELEVKSEIIQACIGNGVLEPADMRAYIALAFEKPGEAPAGLPHGMADTATQISLGKRRIIAARAVALEARAGKRRGRPRKSHED